MLLIRRNPLKYIFYILIDKLNNKLSKSNVDDWYSISGRIIYKNNLAISILIDSENTTSFNEKWLECFQNPKGYRQIFYLQYNGAVIKEFYTVLVDGARMYIPFPRLGDMTLSNEEYRIGRIVNFENCNVCDEYDNYLERAKITVEQ